MLLFQGSADFSESISARKYPKYKDYQQRVPKFVPKLFWYLIHIYLALSNYCFAVMYSFTILFFSARAAESAPLGCAETLFSTDATKTGLGCEFCTKDSIRDWRGTVGAMSLTVCLTLLVKLFVLLVLWLFVSGGNEVSDGASFFCRGFLSKYSGWVYSASFLAICCCTSAFSLLATVSLIPRILARSYSRY